MESLKNNKNVATLEVRRLAVFLYSLVLGN
jgi:hypothetical protein